MLFNSFIHLPGVGLKKERSIWRAGVRDWRDFALLGEGRLPGGLWRLGLPVLERGLDALAGERPARDLAGLFPSGEHWRLAGHFERRVYLDIETGEDLSEWGGVTVVGLWDGVELRQFVAGHNMWLLDDAMKGYDVVVTFAGARFDLPVLKKTFSKIHLPPIHLDLLPLTKRLGLKGGLKRIEKILGLPRDDETDGLSGWDAVRLWREHQNGSTQALPLLLRYNAFDIKNLQPLADIALAVAARRLFRGFDELLPTWVTEPHPYFAGGLG